MTEEARSHWKGFQNLRYLVVLYASKLFELFFITNLSYNFSGASYCDVGYAPKPNQHPSEELPLGVPYPGVTYAEPGKPNWVGFLATEFSPSAPRPLVIFDYGLGGSRVENVVLQIKEQFVEDIADKPEWANWNSEDTLFGRHTKI